MKSGFTTVCLAFASATMLSMQPALAQSSQIVFAVSGSNTCVYTGSSGFSAYPELVLFATPNVRTSYMKGQLTFDLTGTGTYSISQLQIYGDGTNLAVGKSPVIESSVTCNVAYQSQSDGTYKIELKNCSANLTAGASIGTTTMTSTITLAAVLSPSGEIVKLTDVSPTVESGTFTPTTGNTSSFTRICGRNLTGVRIP